MPALGGQAPARTAKLVTMPVCLTVNGKVRDLDLDTRTTLLDALREHLKLTGTKKGFDHGQCGACTVIVNGSRIKFVPDAGRSASGRLLHAQDTDITATLSAGRRMVPAVFGVMFPNLCALTDDQGASRLLTSVRTVPVDDATVVDIDVPSNAWLTAGCPVLRS